MGIIGTVMGLVHILGNLSSNPDALGPQISVAFWLLCMVLVLPI